MLMKENIIKVKKNSLFRNNNSSRSDSVHARSVCQPWMCSVVALY